MKQDSNYDEPWKAFILNHFRWFLTDYFPGLAKEIDFSIEPIFDPTEVSQFLGQSKKRNRFVDVVAQVTLLNGRTQLMVLHFEIQTKFASDLGKRLHRLNCGLQWQFPDLDVVSLVIRSDLAKRWEKLTYHFNLDEFQLKIEFPTCKLTHHLDTNWKDNFSLPAMVARAQIEALRTTSDVQARYEAKKNLIRTLYLRDYERDEVLEILRYLDWMMHLSEDLEVRLRSEMKEFRVEQQLEMTEYITSWERMAKAEGIAEGKAEGEAEAKLEMLLRLLNRMCGELPDDIASKIPELSEAQRSELFDDAIEFSGLEDLNSWLAEHSS